MDLSIFIISVFCLIDDWLEGEPNWKKNLAAAFDTDGIVVGESNGLKGVYALGIRCRSCKKLVIDCDAS